jgi:serine protease Do
MTPAEHSAVIQHLVKQARPAPRSSMAFAFAILIASIALFVVGLVAAATTYSNKIALRALTDRIEDHTRKHRTELANILSAEQAAGPAVPAPASPTGPQWDRLVGQVIPAVVAVSTLRASTDSQSGAVWDIPGTRRNFTTWLLGEALARSPRQKARDRKRVHEISCGGFSIGDGRIVTAAHCLLDVEEVRIRTAQGNWREATIVGLDQTRDIGVLSVHGEPLPTIAISARVPRQGEPVMAIGAPAGYGFAIGTGVVAWHGEDAQMFSRDEFILVTASIIGGNSGGVVVNSSGEAVSVVSYGYSAYTQTIPIGRAMEIANALTLIASRTKGESH